MTLSAEQLKAIREAVAEQQRNGGLDHLAERTLAGELDGTPMMQAAIGAVQRVLEAGQ